MGFYGALIMATGFSFYNTFPIVCGRGLGLETATCPKTAVGCNQGHTPSENICSINLHYCGRHILRNTWN